MRDYQEVEILLDIVIECPAGQRGRYEFDKSTQSFSLAYDFPQELPIHYGWLENTLGTDGEALDVMLLPWEAGPGHPQTRPGSILKVRPLGILRRKDGDHKLLAVLPGTTPWGQAFDLGMLDKDLLAQIQYFAEQISPVAGWGDVREAWEEISRGFYACQFPHLVEKQAIAMCEKKLTKQDLTTQRTLIKAEANFFVTERILILDRVYYIDGRPVWENGQTIRRWDFPGKWYNLCQLIGRDGSTVGYYQDVQLPILVAPAGMETVDLVLDLWVWPEREWRVLDEHELAELKNKDFLPEPYLSHGFQVVDGLKKLWQTAWFDNFLP
ncbi:MAG TPA: inorganic diphosphatase [Verrucomicrobiae bacterium]|nr:inorganic diphosphatase [Verrucomicrobiae bacterium]